MHPPIKSIRGMNDILPAETGLWQKLENTLKHIMFAYGYQEIRFPIVEKTALFKRSIGEVTDIVEKEMYTFLDRNEDSLTLRPEGTAVCVRSVIEQGLINKQQQRLWYTGPMFRYERPQKGRYRQFHQFGVEVFGISGPDIDAELIMLSARLWKELKLDQDVRLEINSLGSLEARAAYKDVLVEYFQQHKEQLDEDSQRRLHSNPLRILDSKNSQMAQLNHNAPKLIDYLDESSKNEFEQLCQFLDQANISYTINSRLVRGLDYYNKLVFEWVTDKLGAQGTVCAGGRYDGLVEQLHGRATPAVGLAMGLERLISLLSTDNGVHDTVPHAVLLMMGENAQQHGLMIAERIRDALPCLRLLAICGGGSFKSQMKKADKSMARFALILADEEISQQTISVKYLRKQDIVDGMQQQQLSFDDVIKLLNSKLS